MHALSRCPKCGDPLLNTCRPYVQYSFYWDQECTKHPDHRFVASFKDDRQVFWVEVAIRMNPLVMAVWDLESRRLEIIYEDNAIKTSVHARTFPRVDNARMPFFQPDLSNYDRLLKKLRIYDTFS